jgi:hypothetical protein
VDAEWFLYPNGSWGINPREVLGAVSVRPLPALPAAEIEGKLNLPAAFPRGDEAIHRDVRRLVGDVIMLADAGLRVDAGVVGLLGRTCSRQEAEAVRRAVAGIPGVTGVRGQIECSEMPDRG